MAQEVAVSGSYEIHINKATNVAIGDGATVNYNPSSAEKPSASPRAGIARLWAKERPVGMATLIEEKRLLTVAHVVAKAWGEKSTPQRAREAPVRVEFPLVASEQWLEGRVIGWWPEDDLALLSLSDVPTGAIPLPLLEEERSLNGHHVRAYGTPSSGPGVWAEGKVMGVTEDGLQVNGLTAHVGYGLQGGFSGAPLWDDTLGCCVGIVRSGMEGRRVAFAIPVWKVTQRLRPRGERSVATPPNPFGETRPIRDKLRFVGRQEEMRTLFDMLEKGSSVVVQGEPKIGKTSLLYRVEARWKEQGGRSLGFVDFQRLMDLEDFYAELREMMKLSPECSLRKLRKAWEKAEGLLIFDEFDYAPQRGITEKDVIFFRALTQGPLRILAASRRPLKEVFPDDGTASPFYNVLNPLRLGPLTEKEARILLDHPWAAGACRFSEPAVEELLRLTGRHPFLLHLAAYHRYRACLEPSYDWRTHYEKAREAMM